jgi:hypothetical protein
VKLIRPLNKAPRETHEQRLALAEKCEEIISMVDFIYDGLIFRGTRDDLEEQFPGHGEFAVQLTTTLFIDATNFRDLTSRINFALDNAVGAPQRANSSFVGFNPAIGLMRIHPIAQPLNELAKVHGGRHPRGKDQIQSARQQP